MVLCDFGLAKFLETGCLVRDLVGTPDYAGELSQVVFQLSVVIPRK